MDGRKTILLASGLALSLWGTRMAGQSASTPPLSANPQVPSQSSTSSSPAPNPEAKRLPTAQAIRATTRLVQLSVVIHDKEGHPVTGLKKEDFVILDNKKPQAIQIFSVQTNQPSKSSAKELPPDTYTNRMEARGGAPPNVTVILLDALNTSFLDKAFVRQRLLKY